MTMVKLDQKMRLRIPKKIRIAMKLRGRDALQVSLKNGKMTVSKPSKINVDDDPILRGMIDHPLHSKIKVTSKLLEKWKDEMWMP